MSQWLQMTSRKSIMNSESDSVLLALRKGESRAWFFNSSYADLDYKSKD